MHRHFRLLLCLAAACAALASPIDFGKKEFAEALAGRKISSSRFRIQTEISTDPVESFRISGVRVSGGDLRGLMYGLLEASEQIRTTGRLVAARGTAATSIRGVRLPITAADAQSGWFHAHAHWEDLLATLARSRLNRLTLAFEEEVVLSGRVMDVLRFVSEAASEYAVDLVLSIRPESVNSSGAELKALLSSCPAVRSVRVTGGPGIPGRATLVRAVGDAGRRVVVEIPHNEVTPRMIEEVTNAGVPFLVSASYQGGDPPPPVEGAGALVWRLEPSGAESRDPAYVRKTVQELARPGVAGFEIDAPQDGSPEANRLFYLLWGRLSYNPKTPGTLWGEKPVAKKK